MKDRRYIVLLSGGLDSTAALLHVVLNHGDESVSALCFMYGQPAMSRELEASQRAAEFVGSSWSSVLMTEAVAGGIVDQVLPSGIDASGVNNANVPARNLVFLSVAAARSAHRFPGHPLHLVIGAHADDEATFPDCRLDFLVRAQQTASLALRGVVPEVRIYAPWIHDRKSAILEHFRDDVQALSLLRESVSCYRGDQCGTCGACVQRNEAFRAFENSLAV